MRDALDPFTFLIVSINGWRISTSIKSLNISLRKIAFFENRSGIGEYDSPIISVAV